MGAFCSWTSSLSHCVSQRLVNVGADSPDTRTSSTSDHPGRIPSHSSQNSPAPVHVCPYLPALLCPHFPCPLAALPCPLLPSLPSRTESRHCTRGLWICVWAGGGAPCLTHSLHDEHLFPMGDVQSHTETLAARPDPASFSHGSIRILLLIHGDRRAVQPPLHPTVPTAHLGLAQIGGNLASSFSFPSRSVSHREPPPLRQAWTYNL